MRNTKGWSFYPAFSRCSFATRIAIVNKKILQEKQIFNGFKFNWFCKHVFAFSLFRIFAAWIVLFQPRTSFDYVCKCVKRFFMRFKEIERKENFRSFVYLLAESLQTFLHPWKFSSQTHRSTSQSPFDVFVCHVKMWKKLSVLRLLRRVFAVSVCVGDETTLRLSHIQLIWGASNDIYYGVEGKANWNVDENSFNNRCEPFSDSRTSDFVMKINSEIPAVR